MTEHAPFYVYRLDVVIPAEALDPEWVPPRDSGWHGFDFDDVPRFTWPKRRHYLGASAARRRGKLLEAYGATVSIEKSEPVTWLVGRPSRQVRQGTPSTTTDRSWQGRLELEAATPGALEAALGWLARSRESKSPSYARVHAGVVLDRLDAIADWGHTLLELVNEQQADDRLWGPQAHRGLLQDELRRLHNLIEEKEGSQ